MAASDARELTEEEFQQLSQEERVEHARRVVEQLQKPGLDAVGKRLLLTRTLVATGTAVVIMSLFGLSIHYARKKQWGCDEPPPRPKKQTGLFGEP